MKPTDPLEKRGKQYEPEFPTPVFGEDVVCYDDDTWECSQESFSLMAQSYRPFGFELEPTWSTKTLAERFGFIITATSHIRALDLRWVAEEVSPERLEYLRAVRSGDIEKVRQLLPVVFEQEQHARAKVSSAPRLFLVKK